MSFFNGNLDLSHGDFCFPKKTQKTKDAKVSLHCLFSTSTSLKTFQNSGELLSPNDGEKYGNGSIMPETFRFRNYTVVICPDN